MGPYFCKTRRLNQHSTGLARRRQWAFIGCEQSKADSMEVTMAVDDEAPLTISVPEAGKKYFNLSRDGSYAAAERGEIPTIRVGRLLRVPVRALERMLDIAPTDAQRRRVNGNVR